jgi:predicted ATPase
VVQTGACIGREFPYELLAAISPLKGEKLDDALEQLCGTGLLFKRGTPPDALYTFKHALVQDAAYDSLLKSKRAQLHAQIAEVLEKNFSDRTGNEPEVLAHHFTQGGLYERAVPYLIRAGERSLARMALSEAVGHLTTALIVNERVASSEERAHRELDTRLLLGTAQSSLLGWAAVQVMQTLEPARDLAIRLGEADKVFRILDYSHTYHLQRCDFPEVLKINAEVATGAPLDNSPPRQGSSRQKHL